ncbi:uncharacterized protein LOC128861864 [Anastrepha ludens]|uniref:uncharacterized protein LOC128861864 n=1 Tax=Anastrepha ludens TaxID=28586 RepID=UPI0023B16DA5|nr:uncharacterized protein LOC128861864 [Anastrepha ludens]
MSDYTTRTASYVLLLPHCLRHSRTHPCQGLTVTLASPLLWWRGAAAAVDDDDDKSHIGINGEHQTQLQLQPPTQMAPPMPSGLLLTIDSMARHAAPLNHAICLWMRAQVHECAAKATKTFTQPTQINILICIKTNLCMPELIEKALYNGC